ncbi:MAG: hypothetical protein G3I10_00300 [Ferrovum sp.]|nr:hypothetical protein [Ferrovum sp.]
MIKNFRHKGLGAFFLKGSKAGIQPHHAVKLRLLLTALDNAKRPEDMNVSSWKFHSLTGNLSGHFAGIPCHAFQGIEWQRGRHSEHGLAPCHLVGHNP